MPEPKPSKTALFFLALLPPLELQVELTAIKEELATRFATRHALKSPPHITVFPPFKWPIACLPEFDRLANFTAQQTPVPVSVDGFGAFVPRVIYARPSKTPALLALHQDLQTFLTEEFDLVDPMASKRPFAPHLTLAFRDLTKANFHEAWAEFQERSLLANFTATHLTLLRHNGKRWQLEREWLLGG